MLLDIGNNFVVQHVAPTQMVNLHVIAENDKQELKRFRKEIKQIYGWLDVDPG